MFLVLFSLLTSKYLIHHCKFNLSLRGYEGTSRQFLPAAVHADKIILWSISNDCFHHCEATFLNWDCRMAQTWPLSDRRHTSASEIPLFNKVFEGLRKLDKLQGYYTFQEVKEYSYRWLGMSLGFISFWWQWTCGSAAVHAVLPYQKLFAQTISHQHVPC